MTYEQAAAYCGPGMTSRFLRRKVEEGLLMPYRLGGKTLLSPDDLDALIEESRGAPHVRGRRSAA